MGLLTTAAARYQAQLTYWTTIQTNLQAQLTARTLGQPIDSYSFDSGEGRQSTDRMDSEQLMRLVESAGNLVAYYERKLYGGNVVTLNLRRKDGT